MSALVHCLVNCAVFAHTVVLVLAFVVRPMISEIGIMSPFSKRVSWMETSPGSEAGFEEVMFVGVID